jgi:hypothetical protein
MFSPFHLLECDSPGRRDYAGDGTSAVIARLQYEMTRACYVLPNCKHKMTQACCELQRCNMYYSQKVSFILGQVKDTGNPLTKVASLIFPPNLALDYLYPEASVTYTQEDGSFLDVACFTPGLAEVQKVICCNYQVLDVC